MKTAKEWFETLETNLANRAISNTPAKDLSAYCRSLQEALFESFDWAGTKEDVGFWLKVYEDAEAGSTILGTPPPVDETEEKIRALRGWRIGDLARVKESGHVSCVEGLFEDLNLELCISDSDETEREGYHPRDLINLSRGD